MLTPPAFIPTGPNPRTSLPSHTSIHNIPYRPAFRPPPRRSLLTSCIPSAPVILEDDLLAYRPLHSLHWHLGAVIAPPEADNYLVRPLLSRTQAPPPPPPTPLELFVDWDTGSTIKLSSSTHELRLVDADFEHRVIQDRLQNPHGELSEPCWRVALEELGTPPLPIRHLE